MIAFTILGEPASKANSRIHKPIKRGDTMGVMVIKSQKALDYERDALRQIPPRARVRLEGPVIVTMRIFYASERPDLDESLVLDVLQDRFAKDIDPATGKRRLVQHGVYRNDRQVRERHVYHAIDRANPRCELIVEPRQAQQEDLLASIAEPDPMRMTAAEKRVNNAVGVA